MLAVALKYENVYNAFTANKEHGLRAFELTRREWRIARDLAAVLKDATEFFSRGVPTLSIVIPAMDHIDTTLTNDRLNDRLDPAIRKSIGLAKKTLNRYYALSDLSATYRISHSLDPRYELRYYEEAQWSQEWIDNVRGMLRDEYDRHY
ncbi:hypothetical protein C8Q76DRAFT_567693, partial [Earliella scabrosa]